MVLLVDNGNVEVGGRMPRQAVGICSTNRHFAHACKALDDVAIFFGDLARSLVSANLDGDGAFSSTPISLRSARISVMRLCKSSISEMSAGLSSEANCGFAENA